MGDKWYVVLKIASSKLKTKDYYRTRNGRYVVIQKR